MTKLEYIKSQAIIQKAQKCFEQLQFEPVVWTIEKFLSVKDEIDCNPINQRLNVPNSTPQKSSKKPSKFQSIIDAVFCGKGINEIILVKIAVEKMNGKFKFRSCDGGHRKRAIIAFRNGEFPTHASSVIGSKYYWELTDEERQYFLDYKLRFCLYEPMTPRQEGELFRNSNNSTPVNDAETLNSYGDIPIANLIREYARIVPGVSNDCHPLFSSYLTKGSLEEKFANVSFNNYRLKIDELVSRIVYMVYRGEVMVPTPYENLIEMYEDPSLDEKTVKSIGNKTKAVLNFMFDTSLARKKLKSYRGITFKEATLLYRFFFHMKEKYGNFEVENYDMFWREFEKAYGVFDSKNPLRTEIVEKNRLIHEAFNEHLGEHKTQYKMNNLMKWFLEEFNFDKATVKIIDTGHSYPRDTIELKLSRQNYLCWVDGKPLTMAEAEGGHIIARKNCGMRDYDNLVVVRKVHNQAMGTMNAKAYKEMWLAKHS
jgi:hypothetical protein